MELVDMVKCLDGHQLEPSVLDCFLPNLPSMSSICISKLEEWWSSHIDNPTPVSREEQFAHQPLVSLTFVKCAAQNLIIRSVTDVLC